MNLQSQKSGTIKVGALLPLTGNASEYGQWIKKSLELGKDEINAQGGIGGKKLKIIYEDDQADPKKAVLGMKKLCAKHKVPIVFGSWASSCVSAQAPIAQKTRTVVLAEAIAPKLTKGRDYLFSIQPSAAFYIEKLAPFAFFDLGVKKMGVLYMKNDFGISQKDYFKKIFKKVGGKIVLEQSFLQGQNDFKKELTKIKKAKIQTLFVPAYTEIVQILLQAKKMGLNIKFLASPPFENKEIIKKAGSAAEGVVYPYHYAPDPANILDVKFRKNYRRKYKEDPEGFAALAYIGINLIAKALKACGGKKNELKKIFYQIHYYGITGEVVFDKGGNPVKKIIIKTVRRGKFVRYPLEEQKYAFFICSSYLAKP